MFTFLNSGILFVASAVAIPVIIYLFAKKKPLKIVFSSIRFIKESQQKQRKKINLKNILLLIIRMLIILFTILAISRPAIKTKILSEGSKHPKTAIAIILDNSYSMNYLVDTQTELEKGKLILQQLNGIFNQDDVIILFTLDDDWNTIHSKINYGKFSNDLINKIEVTAQAHSFAEVMILAEKKIEEAHLPNSEIYFITDKQKQKYPEKFKIPTFIIPTSQNTIRNNISCQNAEVVNEIMKKDLQKVITFELINHSKNIQNDVVCQLFFDENTIAEKATNLLPNQKKKLEFTIDVENNGWHSGFVKVKNERQTFDNRNYFSFYQNQNPKVAVISDVSKLSIIPETILNIYSKNIEIINSNNINYDKLKSYDNIIVYKKEFITEKLKFVLNKFKNDKKGILFLTEENTSVSWQKFYADFFDCTFSNFDKKKRSIDFINEFHSITKLLKDAGQIELKNIWNVKSNVNILVQSQTNPIVLENENSLLWLFDIDNIQNPFTLHSAFPILVYNSLKFMANGGYTSYKIGDKLVLDYPQITLPNGNLLELNNNFFYPQKAGVYKFYDDEIAVNLNYPESNFELISKEKKINLIFCSEKWIEEILQSRYGFELWKYLLIAVLLLIALEMIIVKKEERK